VDDPTKWPRLSYGMVQEIVVFPITHSRLSEQDHQGRLARDMDRSAWINMIRPSSAIGCWNCSDYILGPSWVDGECIASPIVVGWEISGLRAPVFPAAMLLKGALKAYVITCRSLMWQACCD
jgi:hypothetical protein